MGVIADKTLRSQESWVLDMCIDGNILIVPRCNEKTILFYELGWKPE